MKAVLGTLIVVLLFASCTGESQEPTTSGAYVLERGDLTLEVGTCDVETRSVPGEPEVLGSDGYLEVKSRIEANCAARITDTSYEFLDGTILLSYEGINCPEDICARCRCTYELTWTLEGISEDEYGGIVVDGSMR